MSGSALTAGLEQRLAARRPAVVLALAVAAVALRLLYFFQLGGGPLLRQHLWDQTDMSYFDAWAREIAAGDWLSRRVQPPLHQWHQRIAAEYFRQNPRDELSPPGGAAPPADRARVRALWDRWCGGGRFYQDPLYAYLVALTYRLFGPDVRWVFAWQLAVGVLTIVLVWAVARQCFGDLVAAVAGIIAVLYAPLLLYEMILLRDSLVVFAGLGLAWLAARQLQAGTPRGWLGLGMALGVAMTLKFHFVLYLAGLAVAVSLRARGRPSDWGRCLAPLVAGAILGVLPGVARNVAVGVPPFGLATNGPVTFILANGARAGTTQWDVDHAAGILQASRNRFLPAAAATLKTHPGAGSYLRLLWSRFAASWQWFESPNNENFYYYRLHAPVLRALLTFTFLAPPGIVGLLLALPAWRRCLALYLLVLTSLAVLVTTFVLSRYRISLATALIPFAALFLVRLARWVEGRRWGRLLAGLAAVAAVSFWTARERPAGTTRVRVADVLVAYGIHYMPMANAAARDGDWRRAAAVLRESLDHEPPEARALGPARPARGPEEAALGQALSRVHATYAEALRTAGDAAGAAREERRSRELAAAAQR